MNSIADLSPLAVFVAVILVVALVAGAVEQKPVPGAIPVWPGALIVVSVAALLPFAAAVVLLWLAVTLTWAWKAEARRRAER